MPSPVTGISGGVGAVIGTAAIPTPASIPVGLKEALSMAEKVNSSMGKAMKVPATIQRFNTKELGTSSFFHFVIYSDTSARKTSTAAQFGTPENTRIIITRRKEQMIPLRDMGYESVVVTSGADLLFALQYPEQIWPDWAKLPDKFLLLDDATEAVEMMLEDEESRDARQNYKAVKGNLRSAVQSVLSKPMHFGIVCMAKVKDNPISNEERVGPDLPPSMLNLILAEFEFVFYVKTSKWTLLTDRDRFSFTDTDPSNPNKEKTFTREIFAKNKLSLTQAGKNVLAERRTNGLEEDLG
jgi:hypothetical protein